MVMGLEMDLEMVAAREGTGAVLALVALVAGVQLDVPISASFVLEWSITKIASVDGVWVVERTIGATVWAKWLVHQRGRWTN